MLREMMVHTLAEEAVLYPVVAEQVGHHTSELRSMFMHSHVWCEHIEAAAVILTHDSWHVVSTAGGSAMLHAQPTACARVDTVIVCMTL